MTNPEFPHRNPETDNNAYVGQMREWLETLPPGQAEDWCQGFYKHASQQWSKCNNSFRALFDRLNLYNSSELNLFDINIDQDTNVSATRYMRIWRNISGNTYNTSKLLRYNNEIIDREETNSFSDTFEYRFGPSNDHIATIKIQDDIDGRVKLANKEGEQFDARTQQETAVLLCALEAEVIPSIKHSRQRLAELWNAIQNIENS